MAKSEVEDLPEKLPASDEAPDDWRTDTIKGYRIDKPRRKRWWAYPLTLLLIAGSGYGIYQYLSREPAATTDQAQDQASINETQLNWPTSPTQLIYAYKENDVTAIRTVALKDGKKADLFEFEERLDVGDDGELGASAALTPDGKSLTYVDEEGLKIWDVAGKTSRNLITRGNPRSISTPDWSLDFKDNSPQVQELLRPVWSIGGAYIGLTRLHTDNSSFGVHRADNAAEIDLGETFSSKEENKALEYKFSAIAGREKLKDMRLFPEHYLKIEGGQPCGAIFSPDAKRLAVCMQPNITEGSSVVNDPEGERDMLLINTDDFSYEKIDSDYFSGAIAFSGDGSRLMAVALDDELDPSESSIRSFSIISGAPVESTGILHIKDGFSTPGDVEAVQLYVFDKPYAVVRSTDNTGSHAIILDINAQDQMADFWVDAQSHFELLGVR